MASRAGLGEASAPTGGGESIDGTDITILDVGPEFSYTVPSFSVLTVYIRQVSIQLEQADNVRRLEGFIRSDQMLDRIVPPFLLTVTSHCLVDVSAWAN